MKKFLLTESGNFYKANLHCHTNLSDGSLTPQQVKELYKSKGYSVVAFTDHDILIPHDDLNDKEFLALNGFEMEINEIKDQPWPNIKTCHICFVGLEPDNIVQPLWNPDYLFENAPKYKDLVTFDPNEPVYIRHYSGEGISEIMQKARGKGFFVTYNHPAWSKETYAEYMNYYGMHAMEMFNGSSYVSGFDEYNSRVYDDLLSRGQKLYCIGTDDNHNRSDQNSPYTDSGVAFTVIKAESLEYRAITKALEDGNFYASEGPEIKELYYEDGKVYIKCSPAQRITISYGVRNAHCAYGENGMPITQTCFNVCKEHGYFRLTVVDENGKRACTNAYMPEDVFE